MRGRSTRRSTRKRPEDQMTKAAKIVSRRAVMTSMITAAFASARRPAAAVGEPVTILRVQRRSFEVNGKPSSRLMVVQPDGTQGVMTAVGRQFRARVEN